MAGPNFRLTNLASTKLLLHSLKYPHQTVNGVFLGKPSETDPSIIIFDAVPLQHHWTNLSPMMEVGLGLASNHAYRNQVYVVGYYEAPARLGDTQLSPVVERVAAKIKESFPTPIAVVVSCRDLSLSALCLSVTHCPAQRATFPPPPLPLPFVKWMVNYGSTGASPRATLRLVRHSNILDKFWDCDDYLEDQRVPFLTNNAVVDALNSR
ncbi:hypothetical protein BC826DRAFT_921887 [Russula brevipes]|nr:hypothetical protein BC826DRAFT_921887 [Russula brevipes]